MKRKTPFTVLSDEDSEFIEDLYNQYYPIMKKTAYKNTNDYDNVDDIIHIGIEKLIPNISTLKSIECCKRVAYIVKTIRNAALDYNKHGAIANRVTKIGQEEDYSNSIPDARETPEEAYIMKETKEELAAAMDTLSERDRDLLKNKYFLGYSDEEISEIMNIPINNIRQYLVLARRRLLKKLRQRGNKNE